MKPKTILLICAAIFGTLILLCGCIIAVPAAINLQRKAEDSNTQNNSSNETNDSDNKANGSTPINKGGNGSKARLLGNKKIQIVFVKPKDLPNEQIEDLERILRNTSTKPYKSCEEVTKCDEYVSLNYIPTYLSEQSKKYGVKDLNIKVDIKTDIISVDPNNIEKLDTESERSVNKFYQDFEKILRDNKVDTNNDGVMILYFDNGTGTKKTGSVYENKKFRTVSLDADKRGYINLYTSNPAKSAEFVELTIHEMLHLFYSVDKYIEGSTKCDVKGYGEPNKTPLYPQISSDITCGYIHTSKDKTNGVGNIAKGTIVINEYTAKEIGWK